MLRAVSMDVGGYEHRHRHRPVDLLAILLLFFGVFGRRVVGATRDAKSCSETRKKVATIAVVIFAFAVLSEHAYLLLNHTQR